MSCPTPENSREANRESTYNTPVTSEDAFGEGVAGSRVACTWRLRNGIQITVRKSYATILCRAARSDELPVSVSRNSEFDRSDSSSAECEIVLSSSSDSPLLLLP